MKDQDFAQGQRGIALFAVMFALLLLSVVGLGMMYSTNTETAINANYKDAQIAMYSAMGGLQEGRDRIQPATGTIPPPTGLPSLSSANVIYIINPKGGETVAPWLTTNAYYDTELCQEKVLGLTGTFGIPCSTIASGSSWYSVINDSLSANAPWNLAAPTDVKWVRLTLKSNNSTPFPVNGSSTTATQVCWDGDNQIALPPGYGANCQPNGSIATLVLKTIGTGYTSTPTVTIAAPPAGGTQATATATVASSSTGQVSTVTLTNGGSAFLTAPTVTITGNAGSGSGAAATATISGGAGGAPVTSLTLASTTGTQCYATAPSVTFSGGGGSGAAATTTLAAATSCVISWSPTAHCNSLKNTTVTGVTLSGGSGGSGFSGTITFDNGGHIDASTTVVNPGTGYTANPTTAGGGSPALGACTVTANAVAGYRIASINLTGGGSGYTSAPAVSIAQGAPTTVTRPTATATLGAPTGTGQVTAINLTAGGSGYQEPLTVTLSGGGGTGATATGSTGTTTQITGLTLTNAGLGYVTDPTVTISGGGGTGATAVATIGRGTSYGRVFLITSFAQTSSGARSLVQMEAATPVLGYTSTGALTIDGPSPTINTFPNSNQFYVRGNDGNSCSETALPEHPAVAGYDNPNAIPATHSVQTIVDSIPRPDHYIGDGGCPLCTPPIPSVQNGFESLGETMGTPAGLRALIDAIHDYAVTKASTDPTHAAIYGNNPSGVIQGDATHPVVAYVDGDYSQNNTDGYGILVVTGRVSFGGNFAWHGPILAVGDGEADFNGGGNAQVTGTLIIGKIWDDHTTKNMLSTLASPTFGWGGGGGNGIQYDHCWADNLMDDFPFNPPPSTKPLKVLSIRALP